MPSVFTVSFYEKFECAVNKYVIWLGHRIDVLIITDVLFLNYIFLIRYKIQLLLQDSLAKPMEVNKIK